MRGKRRRRERKGTGERFSSSPHLSNKKEGGFKRLDTFLIKDTSLMRKVLFQEVGLVGIPMLL